MTSELEIFKTDIEEPRTSGFLKKWEEDIETIFPHFTEEDVDFSSLYGLHYKGIDAGIFIYQRKGEELHVHVDFVIPEFRDIGIGKNFFKQKISEFRDTGFAIIVALTNNDMHIKYLKEIGFVQSSKHPHRYELDLL